MLEIRIVSPDYSLALRLSEELGGAFGIEHHLRTPEQGNGLACLAVSDCGVPNLRGLTQVNRACFALNRAVAGRAKVVGLEFDGRESGCSLR